MAIETNGFGENSYNDVAWAQAMAATVGPFKVADINAWRPTVVPGSDRTVSIAPGLAVGCGVRAFNTGPAQVTSPVNSTTTTRWDAIVARFNWDAESVSFLALPGSSQTLPPITTSTSDAARINRIPGVMYDALIGVATIDPGTGAFGSNDLFDVRPFGGEGALVVPQGFFAEQVDAAPGTRLIIEASGRQLLRSSTGWRLGAPEDGGFTTFAPQIALGGWTNGVMVRFDEVEDALAVATINMQAGVPYRVEANALARAYSRGCAVNVRLRCGNSAPDPQLPIISSCGLINNDVGTDLSVPTRTSLPLIGTSRLLTYAVREPGWQLGGGSSWSIDKGSMYWRIVPA